MGLDTRRVPNPVRPATPDLASTAAAAQAALDRGLDPLGEGTGELAGGIEAAGANASRRGRYRHHGAAQQVSGCEPLDPVGHQVGDRE